MSCDLEQETWDGYKNKLKSRLYGVLCEKEKGNNYEKFLNSIIIELLGLQPTGINYWAILGKLQSLKYLSYEHFRTTIFECMNLIGGLDAPERQQ